MGSSKKPNSKRVGKPHKRTTRPKKAVIKALQPLTTKQQDYAIGVATGKSKQQAALDAGYSPAMAKNPQIIEQSAGLRFAFQEMIRTKVPADKIAARLAEGLDALDTEFAKFEGAISDERQLVAWTERRQYLELAAKMGGYYVEKQEVTVEDMRKSLENRSDADLDYYLEHGIWPEHAAANGA